MAPVPPYILIHDKYLSEFKSDYEKALVRKNLGIGESLGVSDYNDLINKPIILSSTNGLQEGEDTIANGSYSHAEGYNTETKTSEKILSKTNLVSDAIGSYDKENKTIRAYFGYESWVGCYIIDLKTFKYSKIIQFNHKSGTTYNLVLEKDINSSGFSTFYVFSSEPIFEELTSDYSHAEGYCTQTTNEGEHAEGKYNKSTRKSTLASCGFGTSEDDRKNAYEITTDGKIWIYGVGNYDGTNAGETDVSDLATIINKIYNMLIKDNGSGTEGDSAD